MPENSEIAQMPGTGLAPLGWGILGAANIARNFMCAAIRAAGGQIKVIGASTRERAEAFARDFDIPDVAEGYAAVLENPGVQAIYLPLANAFHFEWAMQCAQAGKHCLCEKPMALTLREARELQEAFSQSNVRLMEGFMWRHHPHTAKIAQMVLGGEIGELRRFHGTLSIMPARREGYRWSDEPGAGALWDLGCYMANGARLFFRTEPQAASARIAPVKRGSQVDCSSIGWIDFGEDRLATFHCSFTSAYKQEFTLVGTKGSLHVHRPLTNLMGPTILQLEIGGSKSEMQFEPVSPYEMMVGHFTRCVNHHESPMWPGENGVQQSAVMEALSNSAAQGGAPQPVPVI